MPPKGKTNKPQVPKKSNRWTAALGWTFAAAVVLVAIVLARTDALRVVASSVIGFDSKKICTAVFAAHRFSIYVR